MLKREIRVAFSRKVQPLWFRIVKWVVFIGILVAVKNTKAFWYVLIGLPLLGVTVHLFYRWKTKGWTQPWGGWKDLEAGRPHGKKFPAKHFPD